MNRHIRLWFYVGSVALLTTHRLPAPIVEEATPTPAATVAKSKPKPEKEERAKKPASQAKTKQSPIAPFVGVWTGTITVSANGVSESSTTAVTVQVLSNGMVYTGNRSWHGSVSADGRALTWVYQIPSIVYHCTLQLVGSSSVNYRTDSAGTLFDEPFVGHATGTLTKR